MHPDYAYLLVGLAVFAVVSFSVIAYLEKTYHKKSL